MILATILLSQTRFSVHGSTLENGSVTLETTLPNASCKKVLQSNFPFITFVCAQKASPLEGKADD